MSMSGFKISSYCVGGGCVAVSTDSDGTIVVADSKTLSHCGPRLSFTSDEWDAFLAGVKNGEFERAALRDHQG